MQRWFNCFTFSLEKFLLFSIYKNILLLFIRIFGFSMKTKEGVCKLLQLKKSQQAHYFVLRTCVLLSEVNTTSWIMSWCASESIDSFQLVSSNAQVTWLQVVVKLTSLHNKLIWVRNNYYFWFKSIFIQFFPCSTPPPPPPQLLGLRVIKRALAHVVFGNLRFVDLLGVSRELLI